MSGSSRSSAPAVERPIARLVVVAAVLLLGVVAAVRLPLGYLPTLSFPELSVDLRLPEGGDLDDLTHRWLVPLEAAVRAVGDVRDTAGRMGAFGGSLRVRFAAGIDAERKAARLESELAALRRQLPARARLSVWPAGQGAGDRSAVVWLDADPGEPLDRSLLEALRDLPQVRAVVVAGQTRRELRVRPRRPGAGDAAALAAAIERGLAVRRLGEAHDGGRRLPVILAGQGQPLGRLPLRRGAAVMPLAAMAEVELHREEPFWAAHLDGQRGLVLLISRQQEASPLALERALRRTFEAFGLAGKARMLIDEAAPLKRLLERLALGFLAAVLASALAAWWLLGAGAVPWRVLALPTALAAALNAFWLAELPLDVTTLPALAVALGCGLVFDVLGTGKAAGRAPGRAAVVVVSALVLPVAVALAGGMLAPLLAVPARAFVLAVAASVAALSILPRPCPPELPRRRLTRPLALALRNPWTVLLGAVALAYVLFVICGQALVPRPGDLAPAVGDLAVSLRFAEGATPAQAEAQVTAVERHLDEMEEVTSHWSVFNRGNGTVMASVRRQDRRLARLRPLALRLQTQLAASGASARVVPLASGGGDGGEARFSDRLSDRPETDKEATYYRFLLRHTDAETLRSAHARVMDRLARLKYDIWYDQVHADWGQPTTRVVLVPRPGADAAAVSTAATLIARGASLPAARPMAAGSDLELRVLDRHSPSSQDEVRQRAELLGPQVSPRGEPVVPAALFEAREVIAPPTVKRQAGRFVLPMTVRIAGSHPEHRKNSRSRVHRVLGSLHLAAGADLERPQLNPAIWTEERLRMLAIGGALPLLLLALAICRLNSFAGGLAALVPPVLAVGVAAPWVQASRGHVDEMTLLALAAVLAGCFPLALEAAAATAGGVGRLAGGITYRWLARRAVGLALAMPALLALLLVPGLGLDIERHPWALPLRIAGVAATALAFASFLCLPVLLRTLERLRHRDRRREAERVQPPAWSGSDTATLKLAARNVTKVYGNGFAALSTVSFHLEPGIVGLLGPNGAGKTTLLRLLCGLLEPSRGQVHFHGVPITPENLPEYRRLVGYLPQDFNAYEGFTGTGFLDYWAVEKGMRDRRERRREVERLLVQVGLEEAAGRKVRDYSGGMRRRIGIARALLGSPPIVIVDEPTTGLDVEARNRLRESLLSAAGERVIVFSTHLASDVAATASRILLLHRGRLLYDGPASGLTGLARGRVFETELNDAELRELSTRFRVTTRVRTLSGVRVRAVAHGDTEPAGRLVEPNLEEAYLAVIGEESGTWGKEKSGEAGSLLDLSRWDSRVARA